MSNQHKQIWLSRFAKQLDPTGGAEGTKKPVQGSKPVDSEYGQYRIGTPPADYLLGRPNTLQRGKGIKGDGSAA